MVYGKYRRHRRSGRVGRRYSVAGDGNFREFPFPLPTPHPMDRHKTMRYAYALYMGCAVTVKWQLSLINHAWHSYKKSLRRWHYIRAYSRNGTANSNFAVSHLKLEWGCFVNVYVRNDHAETRLSLDLNYTLVIEKLSSSSNEHQTCYGMTSVICIPNAIWMSLSVLGI